MCSSVLDLQKSVAWTAGSTTTTVAHYRTGPIPAVELHQANVTIEIRRPSSSDIQLRAFISYSNDGETWDTPVEFGPSFTATVGFTYGTSFTDLTALGTRKRFARFGLFAKNVSGSDIEYCDAGLAIDLED